jgi:hypothetical protein
MKTIRRKTANRENKEDSSPFDKLRVQNDKTG